METLYKLMTAITVSVTGHGECEAGRCQCFSGWEGDRCQCPSASAQHCVNPRGQVCSGRGTCVCGRCECTDPRSIGRFCEHCPKCHSTCSENWYVFPISRPTEVELFMLCFSSVFSLALHHRMSGSFPEKFKLGLKTTGWGKCKN